MSFHRPPFAPVLSDDPPQAPVHCGAKALESYIARLDALPSLLSLSLASSSLSNGTSGASRPIKSFRYLLQDSPEGFSTSTEFIDGLKYLGANGYAFDMTVDAGPKQRGPEVLEEAITCISKVREGQDEATETKFILGALHLYLNGT